MSGAELKAGARKLIMENSPKLFLVSIIFIVIVTVLSELQFRLIGTLTTYTALRERLSSGELPNLSMLYTEFRPPGAALALVLYMLNPVIEIGFMSYCLKTTRAIAGDVKDVLNGFQYFIKVILLSIMIAILVFLWSMLFLFPGIVASYRYRQAYYILLDAPEKGVMQCIRESKQLMAGSKLDLFLVDLSFIGWFFLDVIVVLLIPAPFAIPVVSIWLTPYIGLTHAGFYERLLNRAVI